MDIDDPQRVLRKLNLLNHITGMTCDWAAMKTSDSAVLASSDLPSQATVHTSHKD